MSNTSLVIRNLKDKNPIKFLEAMPELLLSAIFEKLPHYGYPKELSRLLVKENQRIIDKKLKSKYNLYDIALGGVIFITGRYIATNIGRKNKEGGK